MLDDSQLPGPGVQPSSQVAVADLHLRPADAPRAPVAPQAVPRRRSTDGRTTQRLPFVVAHRGASGVLPEHTLPGFARAIALGADAIEVDVVPTADGRLIARHEPELVATTDASMRADLVTLAQALGSPAHHAGELCAHDLPLRDITRLRARQRSALRPLDHDDHFMVPTLAQVLGLARRSRTKPGRVPAVHIELKEPARHAALGLSMEREVVKELAAHGWNRPDAPVLVMTFEADSLLLVAGRTSVPVMQLARLDDEGLARCTDRGLEAIATYAVGIGISRELLAQVGDDVVARAHRRGLVVHVYTFADDDPRDRDPQASYGRALRLGIDGLITDFPDSAVRARNTWADGGSPTL
jgi:glycerophosphoryl diester phosphodiesterase